VETVWQFEGEFQSTYLFPSSPLQKLNQLTTQKEWIHQIHNLPGLRKLHWLKKHWLRKIVLTTDSELDAQQYPFAIQLISIYLLHMIQFQPKNAFYLLTRVLMKLLIFHLIQIRNLSGEIRNNLVDVIMGFKSRVLRVPVDKDQHQQQNLPVLCVVILSF